jgi:hypothetical protein
MRKIGRWCLRLAVGLVALAVLFVVGLTIASLVVSGQRRKELLRMIASAEKIQMEEFVGRRVISSNIVNTAAKGEFEKIFSGGSTGLPSLKLCFVPHHRIVATTATATNTLTICFGCDQGRLDNGAIFDLPAKWHAPLREAFRSRGIPVRTATEYRNLWVKAPESATNGVSRPLENAEERAREL